MSARARSARGRRWAVAAAALVLVLAAAAIGVWRFASGPRHLYDEAGLIREDDRPRFEQYLGLIAQESDVDLRFVFVKSLGDQPLEAAAVDRMQRLGIGGRGSEARGALLLYDAGGRRLRIEVGYGLEEYFPDAFVGYLMHDHARAFFESGDLSLGLRLTIRILHDRIRSAILGDPFVPSALGLIRRARALSGGAGASAPMAVGRATTGPASGGPASGGFLRATLEPEVRAELRAGDTPEETYRRYLDWLARGEFDPAVAIFTPESRGLLSTLSMTRGYFDWILLTEHGRAFRADRRGALALLTFTDDPLLSPHFLRRTAGGWKMDIAAEVRNTRNRVGGPFAWDYVGRSDDFSRAFADRLVTIDGVVRIAGGDNRKLATRGSGARPRRGRE